MSVESSNAPPSSASDAHQLPTPEELSQALKVDVFDREGAKHPLGNLVDGKKTVVIFIRHFWCLNCQAYVRCMSQWIPPENLQPGTQILIIGCGSYQPINDYIQKSSSLYPIYTDPTHQLHSIFKFKSNLSEGANGDEQRDYMRDAGSAMARLWGGIKGALGGLQHVNYVGPKSLNGGEVIISADGKCEYIYRMQNTVDHTNISELADLLGVHYVAPKEKDQLTHASEAVAT
ncbi:hypothetical protein T440DRAFT_461508 [Plenodomus tracheiphilus IPT5]|uniref:Thioredoxin-like protein AAED1 n=1 Tax=Plenodomus tracheiphilus IPT5 TaxID=1408161 RepID=A0A6A7ANJ8_9PLEO|nr:hypothetical protein T440DRAFT_461508 [Plenodomus tracheiphilus IPT5]